MKASFKINRSVSSSCDVKVLVIFDTSDGAFEASSHIIREMYLKMNASVKWYPLTESVLPTLEEFVNNPRILVHYIGHGLNEGQTAHPSVYVSFCYLFYVFSISRFLMTKVDNILLI